MNPTDRESLRGLAQLARLSLSEKELALLAPELERILSAFSVLASSAAPTPAAAPGLSHGEPSRAREDEPLPSLPNDVLLASASASLDGFYVVPKTVGGES